MNNSTKGPLAGSIELYLAHKHSQSMDHARGQLGNEDLNELSCLSCSSLAGLAPSRQPLRTQSTSTSER